MADGYWSPSSCVPARADTSWFGYPGQGAYYRSPWGTHWVGATQTPYGWLNRECGQLGPPVKEYGWISEFGAYGQWFLGGVLFYRNGGWYVAYGNYGQTGLAVDEGDTPWVQERLRAAPKPPESDDPPTEPAEGAS